MPIDGNQRSGKANTRPMSQAGVDIQSVVDQKR